MSGQKKEISTSSEDGGQATRIRGHIQVVEKFEDNRTAGPEDHSGGMHKSL
jgi:hypothetical protein